MLEQSFVIGRCVAIFLFTLTVHPRATAHPPLPTVPWPATDGLDRTLPLHEEVGPPRPDRFVGIFYFLWHNQPGLTTPTGNGPYDVSKILRQEPNALRNPASKLWGPVGSPHYWGQPLYGYYRSEDPWVLRRHAYFLADAGVDVLIFDTTNAVTYPKVYQALCDVFVDLRRRGESTPQIAFMVNTRAGETADTIYQDLYEPRRYQELWFYWNDKPLLICDPAKASESLREFFTLRRAHWPFTMVDTDRAWHWEAAYPQPYGYVDDSTEPEQVNVSVAQNLRRSDGKVTNMSDGNARGRSFHNGHIDTSEGAVNQGLNFAEQWSRAFAVDPPFVMITGWNEWIAGRFQRTGQPVVFVDQFNQEYSRDIEFARNHHFDHYYYQMVANIRRLKGTPPIPQINRDHSIDIAGSFDQWIDVAPEFKDHLGETIPRDHAGVGGTHYRNDSGRNDLAASKVTADLQHVYFYVRAAQPFFHEASPSRGRLWLLIDSDRQHETGWKGYDYLAGRDIDDEGNWSLEEHIDQWEWKKRATLPLRIEGNQLHVALPRSLFRPEDNSPITFDFKWTDNLPRGGDVRDFYLSGDVAPEGRFRYRAVLSNAQP